MQSRDFKHEDEKEATQLEKARTQYSFSWKMELFFLCHIWNFVSSCLNLCDPLCWWHVVLRGHGLYVVIINYYCLVKLMDENHAVSVQTYHADNSIWGWIWKLKLLQLLEWLRHITWLGLLCSMCWTLITLWWKCAKILRVLSIKNCWCSCNSINCGFSKLGIMARPGSLCNGINKHLGNCAPT